MGWRKPISNGEHGMKLEIQIGDGPARSETNPQVKGLADSELAGWLSLRYADKKPVAYAYAKHLFKVYESCLEGSPLIVGDLGKDTVKALRQLSASRILKRIELPYEELNNIDISNSDWILLEARIGDIAAIKRARDGLFGQGRGKAISNPTAAKVWHDAGGRCMYRGCGADLGDTPLTTKIARAAYLAHIVASDPGGPRGDENSHALSDDPENIMLMCDAHHRLIDRVDVNGNPASQLKQMREDHAARVRMLLDGLRYPSAQIITLLADLGHIPTNTYKAELCGAVLNRKIGPLPEIKHMVRRTQRDDRSRPGFWEHFLHEHESDIRELISFTSNRHSHASLVAPDALAIFPLHLVPMLILSGRIIGEARNVEVFQYDRSLATWHWPRHDASESATFGISYEIDNFHDFDETILSFELTANLDINSLPAELARAVQEKRIGWVRIINSKPCQNCINSVGRLDEFSGLARQAIKTIQDSWRSKKVHVFGVSPASTLFKFGQMLQAGNHPIYRVYDRPDGATPFTPALDITGNEVFSVGSDRENEHQISLR